MSISDYVNYGSALSGFIAAYFWYRSTQVKFPDKLHGVTIDPAVFINVDELSEAIKKSAYMNKIAASLSAISMVLMATGLLLANPSAS